MRPPWIGHGYDDDPKVSQSVSVMLVTPDWTQPYLQFLLNKELPEDEVLRRQIMRRAKAYTIIEGQLYKRSATGVYQRCVSPAEG